MSAFRVSAEVEKEFMSMNASSTPYLVRDRAVVRARGWVGVGL